MFDVFLLLMFKTGNYYFSVSFQIADESKVNYIQAAIKQLLSSTAKDLIVNTQEK
jgi:hypothetical protein